jgi:Na+/melibiose symporter-like transporter
MGVPRLFNIFLGIIADNVSCCGSRRRSYLIVTSVVNVLSMVLLMIFGIMYGKVFIMACVVLSQVCMTWCDTISDALIAQASRIDDGNSSKNLNTIKTLAFASGGLLACLIAGSVELQDSEIDPNFYFGTYALLILILVIASIFLNYDLEPDIVLY